MARVFAKTLDELNRDSFSELRSTTNFTNFSPGSKIRAVLEANNRHIAQAYEKFDIHFLRSFLSGASGQWLDYIGEALGTPRLGQTNAVSSQTARNVRFFISSPDLTKTTFGDINKDGIGDPQDINIPKDTLISITANGDFGYVTTDSVILDKNLDEKFISVRSLNTGNLGNVGTGLLRFHSFNNYADVLDNSLKVENVSAILNARETESDTNYRFRLAAAHLSNAKANETALRVAALSVPGVADVFVKSRFFGIGTTEILIQSVFPQTSIELINAVEASISAVEGIGTYTNVRGPREIGVELIVSLNLRSQITDEEANNLVTLVTRTLATELNSFAIGDPLLFNTIIQTVRSLDSRIESIGTRDKPIDFLRLHKPNELEDGKILTEQLEDFRTPSDGRIIIEPSIERPIIVIIN